MTVGRKIGIMLLAQFLGLMVGYISISPISTTDYLATAAANSTRITLGVIVLLAVCALTIAISIVGWRAFREYSRPMAIALVVLAVIVLVVQVIDGAYIMKMVGLSQQQASGGVSNELASEVRMTRRSVHFLELLSIDVWLALFYTVLFRFALVRRLIAGFALLTVLVHFIFIPLAALLGYGINMVFGMGLAFGMVATAGWLTLSGFRSTSQNRER